MKRRDFFKKLGIGVAATVMTPTVFAEVLTDPRYELVEHWFISSLTRLEVHLRSEVDGIIFRDSYSYPLETPKEEALKISLNRFKGFVEMHQNTKDIHWIKLTDDVSSGKGYVWYTKAENEQRKRFEANLERETLKMFGIL